jgi:putative transposase
MPRRRLVQLGHIPYHVTSRSNNKEWFYIPTEECWEIFCTQLIETSLLYQVHILAFTLMSNHFHLMLLTPLSNLGEVMRHFLTGVSKAIQFRAKRINHVFGSRYRWSLLPDPIAVAYVYKYIMRNPVRAEMCKRVEEYPYNSLRRTSPHVPQVDGIGNLWRCIPSNYSERTNWLNQPTPRELEVIINQSLRREVFEFSKDNSKQKAIRELQASYGVKNQLDGDRFLPSLEGD